MDFISFPMMNFFATILKIMYPTSDCLQFIANVLEEDIDLDDEDDEGDPTLREGSKFGFTLMANHLAATLDLPGKPELRQAISMPRDAIYAKMRRACELALEKTIAEYDILKKRIDQCEPSKRLQEFNLGQLQFVNLFEDVKNINIYLFVVVGKALGFPKEPRSESWHHAGRSHMMERFCTVVHDLITSGQSEDIENILKLYGSEPSAGGFPSHDNADSGDLDDDDPNKSDSRILMAIVFLRWTIEMKINNNSFNLHQMKNDWFDKAVLFYQTHRNRLNCKQMSIDAMILQEIR